MIILQDNKIFDKKLMSQVDYLHFFNSMVWNFVQFILVYVFMCVIYFQQFYKVFRTRLLNYKFISIIVKNLSYNINALFDLLKKNFFNPEKEVIKGSKAINTKNNLLKNVIKWFYE